MWTQELISELTRLWNDGLTTSEIGRRIGVSKNAVVGKAHRLGLDQRPSPIKRVPGMGPRESHHHPKAERAHPHGQAHGAAHGSHAHHAPRPARAAKPAQPREARPAPAVEEPKVVQLSNRACSWPIGDPRQPDFTFCNKRALMDKPYCAEHSALAYIPVKKKESAA